MKVIFIPDHPYISNIIRPNELIEARTTGDDYIESALGINHKNPTQFQIVPWKKFPSWSYMKITFQFDFFIEVGDVFATINWVFNENNQVDVSKTQVTFNALATATVEEEVEYYGLSDEELEQRKNYAPDINYTYPISDIESFRDQLISITDRGTIPYWYDKESNKFVQIIE